MTRRPPVLLLLLLLWTSGQANGADKPAFASKVVTSDTPGHAVEVDVDLRGAKHLYLVVADGGNGYGTTCSPPSSTTR